MTSVSTLASIKPNPQSDVPKAQQVAEVFNSISFRYDLLNRVLSFGFDMFWRKRAIKELKKNQPKKILDVATGTGDFALQALAVQPEKIIGLDISEGMLNIGRKKIEAKGVSDKISLQQGDAEQIPFATDTFDAVTVSFGVRNFANLRAGIQDIYRVLKPNGKVVILEFSTPRGFFFKPLYELYLFYVIPFMGKIASKNPYAYAYLKESVRHFPDGENFLSVLRDASFRQTHCIRLTGGICSIYTGIK